MSLPFAVEAIAIGEGWAGIDSSSTDQSLAFFQCCKTNDRGVIQIDVASTGYLTEAENALNGACFVVLYQGYYSGMWADPSTGTTRGQEAVSAAQNVDYPGGCTIYLDVEQTDSVSATTVIDWINNWAAQVVDAGYEAGIYVGCVQPLDSSQLYYDLPNVNHYWETCSTDCRVAVDVRGYQVFQTACSTSFCGFSPVDEDTYEHDALGGYTVGMQKG